MKRKTVRIFTCTRPTTTHNRAALLRRVASAALALAVCCAPAGAQFARPLGDERLAALAARYFAERWRLEPVRATEAGVHDFDDRLGDYSAGGYAERAATARRYLGELDAIDPATFGADASYDAQILTAHLQKTAFEITTLQTWRHDPGSYAAVAARGIDTLLARDFAPLPDRVRAAVARERQIPALLDAARANVTSVDATTAELARGAIRGAIAFFGASVPPAAAGVRDAALRAQLKVANDAAIAALRSYLAALEAGPFAHPAGTFAVGAANFAQLLRFQELTPLSLGAYERAGTTALAKTKAEFAEVARRIDPGAPPATVAASLGSRHPAADALLRTASSDVAALRAFVVAHHLVTLPPDHDVTIVATPPYERATVFARLDAPGPLETKATASFFEVTPVEADWSAERKEQHLAWFDDATFPLVAVHEVMPGHDVNFALARRERLSLVRMLLPSLAFAEGWAHYAEQLVVDEGWGSDDPRVRLAQLRAALERECRLLVGLREHTQDMSVDAATAFFEQNAYLAAEPARREALRGARDPLYGYYTLGRIELLKLRDDDERRSGAKFDLQSFHDRLLAHGDPPIAIARKLILGADDDGKLLPGV